MNEQEILRRFSELGVVITESHIVYASGKHGSAYVNKDALYPHTSDTSDLCRAMARRFVGHGIEVVVAPAVGGVILSQWTAYHLSQITGREVLGTYAERENVEQVLVGTWENSKPVFLKLPFGSPDGGPCEIPLLKGQKIILRKEEFSFVLRRGYDKLIPGKRVLVVEDILTTGDSARKVVEAVRKLDGEVVALAVLCNRGGVKPQDVGDVPELFALVNVTMNAWEETECPYCAKGIPINTDIGKGREFLALKGQ